MSDNNATAKPVSVLFVCTGNICRSTMAEGVFRNITSFSKADRNSLVKHVDSCGTGAYHTGDDPDERTMSVLENNNITDYRHHARKIRSPQDFKDFDYILAMDRSHLTALKALARSGIQRGTLDESALSRIQLFAGAYGGLDSREEVPDPYYGDFEGFVDVYDQVARCCKGLLQHIEEHAGGSRGSL